VLGCLSEHTVNALATCSEPGCCLGKLALASSLRNVTASFLLSIAQRCAQQQHNQSCNAAVQLQFTGQRVGCYSRDSQYLHAHCNAAVCVGVLPALSCDSCHHTDQVAAVTTPTFTVCVYSCIAPCELDVLGSCSTNSSCFCIADAMSISSYCLLATASTAVFTSHVYTLALRRDRPQARSWKGSHST
jgi:hypothetical protein